MALRHHHAFWQGRETPMGRNGADASSAEKPIEPHKDSELEINRWNPVEQRSAPWGCWEGVMLAAGGHKNRNLSLGGPSSSTQCRPTL
ncbi:unnamed protein product [Gadus morhua 'NCC']